jgi:hypothetical protein
MRTSTSAPSCASKPANRGCWHHVHNTCSGGLGTSLLADVHLGGRTIYASLPAGCIWAAWIVTSTQVVTQACSLGVPIPAAVMSHLCTHESPPLGRLSQVHDDITVSASSHSVSPPAWCLLSLCLSSCRYERELRRLRAELQRRSKELVDKRALLEVRGCCSCKKWCM